MKDKKQWVIGILCTLVCIMAVGYAVLAQQLNITGTTSIDSTWKVEITNIGEKEVVGKAVSKVTPSYTSTTANFSVGLTQPGDSITYEVEISNLGTLKAKVDSINVLMDENDAIKYTTTGVQAGDKLGVGEKTTLTIKVEYDSNVTSQPAVTAKDITVTINYVQDLDEENATTTYQTYSIGDQITFAGSNWYVIKNSSGEEDYVTLLKETILTNAELGDYASATGGNTMHFDNTDECLSLSNCSEDYDESYVKEFLEKEYINSLGSNNLKDIDGYKVRLITYGEVLGDLGAEYETTPSFSLTNFDNVPSWIYSVSDLSQINYYTMSVTNTPYGNSPWCIYGSSSGIAIMHDGVYDYDSYNNLNIRPVINLLKTNIS